jgi:hypothetical protein
VPTVSQYMAYWLREVVKPNLAPKTYENMKRLRGCILARTLGKNGWTNFRLRTLGNGLIS